MGLEEPPTACGVPLFSMVKSSLPSVLGKLQESLHKGNSTLQGFLLRTHKLSSGAPGPLLQGGVFFFFFAAFTAQLHDSKCFLHTVLSPQENQRLVSHYRIQSLYTVPLNQHHRTQLKSASYIIGHSLYSLNLHHLAAIAITECTRTRKLPWLAISKPTFSTRVCQGHYSFCTLAVAAAKSL